MHRAPSLHSLPPHCALARASQQCCWQGCIPWLSEVTEGLWSPKFPASYYQPSITHYCTFLLKDPLPLVVVLCIITVSVRAETRHMSYRIMGVPEQ